MYASARSSVLHQIENSPLQSMYYEMLTQRSGADDGVEEIDRQKNTTPIALINFGAQRAKKKTKKQMNFTI